jgi:hypothetical protein
MADETNPAEIAGAFHGSWIEDAARSWNSPAVTEAALPAPVQALALYARTR